MLTYNSCNSLKFETAASIFLEIVEASETWKQMTPAACIWHKSNITPKMIARAAKIIVGGCVGKSFYFYLPLQKYEDNNTHSHFSVYCDCYNVSVS